ncbi:MAG: hypothetical protein EP349_06355 [Alphaproteobacteria bacterium]|nr:MAG: hypothetical protein EP349_06355 [Alphaproteobacteria bacterium]
MATKSKKHMKTEILVAGGGPSGLTMALLLANAGLDVVCVDQAQKSEQLKESFDGRTTAISAASKNVLAAAGVWDALEKDACPILDIRVADTDSPHFLHFASDESDKGAFGWILENRVLRKALFEAVESSPLTHLQPAKIEEFSYINDGQGIAASLSTGQVIDTQLLIGADGRKSAAREWAGIGTVGWSYKQEAIVCCAAHELDHENVAVEHFMPSGPFAILPMMDTEKGKHCSSIVWTEHGGDAKRYLDMSKKDFDAALQARFGDQLGKVKHLGTPMVYPLSLMHAKRYTAPRLALIGEAAHAIHPIAGQGLNLSMRDIALLAEMVVDRRRVGLDIGAETMLRTYQRLRKKDNLLMAAMTDGLNRLFSNNIPPVRFLRTRGMSVVNRLPPLKRFFAGQAMGFGGLGGAGLPRLLRGEIL